MTDQELLRLAALTYGPGNAFWSERNNCFCYVTYAPDSIDVWNPLEDDGDALRLAVHLGIEWRRPMKSRSIGRVVKVWFSHDGNPRRSAGMSLSEPVHGSTAAAVRRAIVRAAAEIGLRMEKELS